ncbi:MAG: cytochrome c oxidase subunit II [Bradyrhizobium sp.]|nr:MAG: cytochrome c oxidase subunit II [Bradyrhizobium sp.]
MRQGGRAARIRATGLVAGAAAGIATFTGAQAATYGYGEPWQIGFQLPVTDLARELQWFHNVILVPLTIIISLFVLALLFYVVWRFNEKANPTPSRTTHNTLIEVIWTIAPVIVLVFISVFSFPLLTKQLTIPPSDMTIKVTGTQWHWSYAYPQDGFSFDSYIKEDKDLKPENGDIRLLAVDNEAVVPVNKVVRVEVTAVDVIHSFIVQSFGVRVDAVPGRLNETWFKADREGIYYGQCSKLCGKDHAFMPIAFRVVSQDKYDAWLASAKQKFAAGSPTIQVAAAPAETAGQ